MKRVIIGLVWLWCAPVWAEYRMTHAERVDLSELTAEWKETVPSIRDCDMTDGTITCRRESGEFSPVERAALDASVTVHNPASKEQRKAQERTERVQAESELRTLGLTERSIKILLRQ